MLKKLIPVFLVITLSTLLLSLNMKKNQAIEVSHITDSVKGTYTEDHSQENLVPVEVTPIDLDKIFDNINESEKYSNEPELWTMLVTGDIMLGRMITYKANASGDFTWAFKETKDLLKDADLTFINLESPMNEKCSPTMSGMIFCADKRTVEGLTQSGIDAASLANNHTLNQGPDGLSFTVDTLNQNNILDVGVKNPKYFDVKNIKVALLGYDDVECYPDHIECIDHENIKKDIQEARNNSDMIVIMFHWGNEYKYKPTEKQMETARFCIDNGADLVLGNHPHWYQPVEIYKNKLIAYSHGNFIFDQMWSQETKEGVVGRYTFLGTKLLDVEYIPIVIEDYGLAKPAGDTQAVNILENLKKISYGMIE